MEFPKTKQQHPGKPLIPLPITDITKLSPGDHVLYRIGEDKYRYDFRSGMVSDIDLKEEKLSIITLTAKGCKEEKFCFSAFPHLHRVEYSPCSFSAKDAISRAHHRRDINDQLYNPLNNNGHHFVTNAKTGQEYSLNDMILGLKMQEPLFNPETVAFSTSNIQPPQHLVIKHHPEPVAFKQKLHSISDIQPGQHLLIKTGSSKQQHVLVEACYHKEQKFTAFIFEGKIKIIPFEFSTKGREVFEVIYEKELCQICSANEAIKRADEAKQLQEKGTIDISERAESNSTHESYQPLFECQENMLFQQTGSYESQHVTPLQEAENIIDSMQREEWNHTSQFITAVKAGQPKTINESCLFEHDVSPVNLTPASAHSPLDEGDHVAIEIKNNEYHHAIVLMNVESKGLLIIPNLNGNAARAETVISKREFNPGFVQLSSTAYRAYRVNYNQSVSPTETKKRVFSQQGEQIWKEKGAQFFATWTKTGNAQQVNMTQLTSENETIKQICPLFKERITSFENIKKGDHLIKCYHTHMFHFIISEIISTESHQKGTVKGIYCLRTKVSESDFPLHVHDDEIYRIQYAETFPPEIAIRRAREEVGERKFDPHARMQFVRWAKTGSGEDIEVEFLKNLSLPFSKSQIQSFAQLNEGDIVVKKETYSLARYYIITEVVTANRCRAVESFLGIKSVILRFVHEESSEMFYRLNYYPMACFRQEDSVNIANYLAHSQSRLEHPFRYGTKAFINYVKTGDSGSVDSDTLVNDRPLSVHYKQVDSACKLLPGDHIIRPLDIKFCDTFDTKKRSKGEAKSKQFHHMMVADKTEKEEDCYVFHFTTEGRSMKNMAIMKTEENIFKCGRDVYRVIYPERLNPKSSLRFLANNSQASEEQTVPLPLSQDDDARDEANEVELDECSIIEHEMELLFSQFKQTKKNPEEYNFFSHNCEHLIMLVSVLSPVSSQIIDFLYCYLKYHSENPFKAIQAAFIDQARNATIQGSTGVASQSTKIASHRVGAEVGTAIVKSIIRTVVRTTISEGAETAVDTVATAGYISTLRVVSGAVGGVFAFGTNIMIEAPICIRGVYKLKRKEKFGQISSTTYKKECAKKVATSTGSVIGGAVGAVAGSFFPVPVVGTLIGTAAGTVAGMSAGNVVGRCIGMAFKDPMKPDFAVVHTHLYT